MLLLLAIFGFTSLLDKKQYGVASLVLVSIGIVAYSISKGDWFGLNSFLPLGSVIVAIYFALTAIAATWFYKSEFSVSAA